MLSSNPCPGQWGLTAGQVPEDDAPDRAQQRGVLEGARHRDGQISRLRRKLGDALSRGAVGSSPHPELVRAAQRMAVDLADRGPVDLVNAGGVGRQLNLQVTLDDGAVIRPPVGSSQSRAR